MHSLFISCPSGIELLLKSELMELSITSLRLGYRGVFVDQWDWSTIYKINYGSRLASRVLLPLLLFRCKDRHSLYQSAQKIDWSQFFKGKETFAIDANVHHHKELRNSLFAAQVLKDAICDQIREVRGQRPSVALEEPDLQFNLYIQGDQAAISLDTSGQPLHKRGYRQMSLLAPIQENLAAALLRLAEFKGDELFFDPCCGSGTLLIEAALIATKTPPGYLRHRWGFMRSPSFNQEEWLRVRNKMDEQRIALPPELIAGIDIDPEAILATKTNLKAAGFLRKMAVACADLKTFLPAHPPQCIIANPPHGKRLGEESALCPLYRALGDFMKTRGAKPGRGYVFTTSALLAKEVGLAPKKRHVLSQGSSDARLLEYDLYDKVYTHPSSK